MESSQARALIISQQLANLRLHRVFSRNRAAIIAYERNKEAMMRGLGQPSDTQAWSAVALAWELAIAAQSCAYLAEQLQIISEKLAQLPIVSPESTYSQLFGSVETMQRLLGTMLRSFVEANAKEPVSSLPTFSGTLEEEIRLQLDRDAAIIMAAFTTSIASQEKTSIDDAGAMK